MTSCHSLRRLGTLAEDKGVNWETYILSTKQHQSWTLDNYFHVEITDYCGTALIKGPKVFKNSLPKTWRIIGDVGGKKDRM